MGRLVGLLVGRLVGLLVGRLGARLTLRLKELDEYPDLPPRFHELARWGVVVVFVAFASASSFAKFGMCAKKYPFKFHFLLVLQ